MFNFQRFALLMRRRLALRKRELLINTAVMLGIAKILIGASLLGSVYQESLTQETIGAFFAELQRSLFGTFVAISASVFASKMFFEYGEKNSCIAHLMLPATKLEKWLAPFLLSTAYFMAVVVAVFYVAQLVNLAVFNAIRPFHIPLAAANGIFAPHLFWETVGTALAVHSIYFLGSIHFRENHWWGTTLVVLLAATVFFLVQFAFSRAAWPKGVEINEHMGHWFATIKDEGIFELPVGKFWGNLATMLKWAMPPVLWGISYLKLAEKEA